MTSARQRMHPGRRHSSVRTAQSTPTGLSTKRATHATGRSSSGTAPRRRLGSEERGRAAAAFEPCAAVDSRGAARVRGGVAGGGSSGRVAGWRAAWCACGAECEADDVRIGEGAWMRAAAARSTEMSSMKTSTAGASCSFCPSAAASILPKEKLRRQRRSAERRWSQLDAGTAAPRAHAFRRHAVRRATHVWRFCHVIIRRQRAPARPGARTQRTAALGAQPPRRA